MNKKRVYFNEFNMPTGNTIYFPYSSGLLKTYVQQFDEINENYEFMPFLFLREPTEIILQKYDNPSVACFSTSLWNYRLNLKLAKLIKEKYSDCLIVFGGPQISLDDTLYKNYPFIDVGVFGEGERMFKNILLDHLNTKISKHHTLRAIESESNIDIFPSPYTENVFHQLIVNNPQLEFKAIMETTRSCPFKCSFCFYGQSDLDKKIVNHSVEYLEKEAEWLGINKIKYVFCADANFGMFKRDIEIAKVYAKIKNKYKFPEKFRVCYGKNATDTIYQTAKILSDSGLSKTVTLAVQSVSPLVLKNINRTNIKSETFVALQKKYNASNIPTYTEIILGLPGETFQSYLDGLEFILQSSTNNQVFIYHCQILPNTDMAKPDYIEKYKIKTIYAPLAEVHGNIRDNSIEQEFEQLVIGSNTMTTAEWRQCAVISWLIQLFYSLKVGQKITHYLLKNYNIKYTQYFNHLYNCDFSEISYFKKIAENISNGAARCQSDERFGNIYYEPEELLFLLISQNKSAFYEKIFQATIDLLDKENIKYNLTDLKNIFDVQSMEIPDPNEYLSTQEYATKVILYGRKSNLNKPVGFQLL